MENPVFNQFKSNLANPTDCPVTAAMKIIGGKWKPIILWAISGGYNRFNEMQRQIPTISKKMLTLQLRELEKDGIIIRRVYPVLPQKVEYSYSEFGLTLKPVIYAMRDWAKEHLFENEQRISPSENIKEVS